MREKAFFGVILAATVMLSGACLMVVDSDQPEARPNAGEFHRSLDFKAGGMISLTHASGNVEVTGWDKNAVEILARVIKEEVHDGSRVRVSSLWDLTPDVQVDQSGDVVRIKTRTPGWPWDSGGGLDYTLNVPSSVDLRDVHVTKGDVTISDIYGHIGVAIVEGSLSIKNFSGSLTAAIQTGQVDVEVLDIHAEDVVDITAQAGNVILRIPPSSNVRIEAESGKGEVSSEIDMGQTLPARRLNGRLGQGGALIRIKAVGGNIRIMKTE